MELYIAICNDRHIDTIVRVFDTLETAIIFAKKFMTDNARFPEDVQEIVVEGCLYYAQYSCEGDSVKVEKSILNEM